MELESIVELLGLAYLCNNFTFPLLTLFDDPYWYSAEPSEEVISMVTDKHIKEANNKKTAKQAALYVLEIANESVRASIDYRRKPVVDGEGNCLDFTQQTYGLFLHIADELGDELKKYVRIAYGTFARRAEHAWLEFKEDDWVPFETTRGLLCTGKYFRTNTFQRINDFTDIERIEVKNVLLGWHSGMLQLFYHGLRKRFKAYRAQSSASSDSSGSS